LITFSHKGKNVPLSTLSIILSSFVTIGSSDPKSIVEFAPVFAKYLDHESLCSTATALVFQIAAINPEAILPYVRQLNTVLNSHAWSGGMIAQTFKSMALKAKPPKDQELVFYLINFLEKVPFRQTIPSVVAAIYEISGGKPNLVRPHVELIKRFIDDTDANVSLYAQKTLENLGVQIVETKSNITVQLLGLEKDVKLNISCYEDLVKKTSQLVGNANISFYYMDDEDEICIKSQDDLDVAEEMVDDEVLKITVKMNVS
jgi:hypothetical protein